MILADRQKLLSHQIGIFHDMFHERGKYIMVQYFYAGVKRKVSKN
jgi:hypothetical protein